MCLAFIRPFGGVWTNRVIAWVVQGHETTHVRKDLHDLTPSLLKLTRTHSHSLTHCFFLQWLSTLSLKYTCGVIRSFNLLLGGVNALHHVDVKANRKVISSNLAKVYCVKYCGATVANTSHVWYQNEVNSRECTVAREECLGGSLMTGLIGCRHAEVKGLQKGEEVRRDQADQDRWCGFVGRVPYIRKQLETEQVCVIGLQETRYKTTETETIVSTSHFSGLHLPPMAKVVYGLNCESPKEYHSAGKPEMHSILPSMTFGS